MIEDHCVLQLKGVIKVFFRGTVDEVTALNNIDLDVYDQDFVTVIGSNGAGKSTLLNIVAGVFPPERGGKVIIRGDDVTNLEEYKHAAYTGRVWQEPGVGTARTKRVESGCEPAATRNFQKGSVCPGTGS